MNFNVTCKSVFHNSCGSDFGLLETKHLKPNVILFGLETNGFKLNDLIFFFFWPTSTLKSHR